MMKTEISCQRPRKSSISSKAKCVSKPATTENERLTTYEILSGCLSFENGDQKLWWTNICPILQNLLEVAQYDVHMQYRHLLFHYRYVLPALGPFPRKGRARVASVIPVGPYELSMNFQNDKATVRFDFDPTSFLSGTSRDPFNQLALNSLVSHLAMGGETVNTRLYYHFQDALSLYSEETRMLHNKVSTLPTTQNVVAWDLKGERNAMKIYFYPLLKSKATGVAAGRIVLDAVGNADPRIRNSKAFALLEEYLTEKGLLSNVYVLAWDCVDGPSRIKIYIADSQVTLDNAADLWTLGGRLNSPTILEGLGLLREFWAYLDVPEGIRSIPDLGQIPEADGRRGLTFNWELKQDSSEPEPKLYLPLSGENDLHTAKGIAAFFDRLGWSKLASAYVDDLCSTFSHVDLAVSDRVLSSISFAFSEAKGPYVTAYYYSSLEYPWLGAKEPLEAQTNL